MKNYAFSFAYIGDAKFIGFKANFKEAEKTERIDKYLKDASIDPLKRFAGII